MYRSKDVANTTVTNAIFEGRTIATIVTNEASVAESWINMILWIHRHRRKLIVGFDVEGRPNRRGFYNKAATLQLCIRPKCMLVQLLYTYFVPQVLVSFLTDTGITFVGVNMEVDIEKLINDHGLQCSRHMDLAVTAASKLRRHEFRRFGLKSLAREILGVDLDKPDHITLSN